MTASIALQSNLDSNVELNSNVSVKALLLFSAVSK